MMNGTVHHFGQVVIDLALGIAQLPERGGDVFADSALLTPGGGFNVIYAATQFGADAIYHGAIGDGPFADLARAELQRIGVAANGPTIPGVDTGISVALTEDNGERTFVSTRGAETMDPKDAFEDVRIESNDVVYVSGYSFCHTANARALERFAQARVGEKMRVLADVGPMVATFTGDHLSTLRSLEPLWSVNEREAAILASRFSIHETEPEALARHLRDCLGSDIVMRMGRDGAWFADAESVRYIPTPSVTTVDTNGAGDAHSGVLCAAWALGTPIEDALLLANCAGALSTTKRGPATCPSREEIELAAESLR